MFLPMKIQQPIFSFFCNCFFLQFYFPAAASDRGYHFRLACLPGQRWQITLRGEGVVGDQITRELIGFKTPKNSWA